VNQGWHDDLKVAAIVVAGMGAAVAFMVAALVGWFTL
jgi:hypothetical protein